MELEQTPLDKDLKEEVVGLALFLEDQRDEFF